MIHDPNRSNLTIVLFAAVAVLGVTVTAGGALATPGHASATAQPTGTQSVSTSDIASWDWWDDDDDEQEDDEQEDDSGDDSPWWEDPWWEDPWWEDDDDSGDGDDGDGEDGTDEPAPADFGVSVSGTNSPVTAGETLTVDATVENTGGQQATQTVELGIDGSTVDSQSVTLDAGESETVSLSWTTAAGDAGDSTATVSTADANARTTVTVEAPAPEPDPATFDVSVASTNAPVTEGGTVDVTAMVENTGGQQATQTISLAESGTTLDSQSVMLGAGESETITLSWTTGSGDAGSYDLTVASANASATAPVTVEAPAAPANFGVAVSGTNSPVTAGETLDVTTTITNDGEQSGTQTVALDVAGGVQDSQSVTLGAGESQQVTLSWTTADGDAGDYTATVSSADASATTSVTVEAPAAPANFAVSGVSSNSPVTAGETLDVTATVDNTGEQSDTQTVELDVAGSVQATEQVPLDAGESQQVTLSWTTADGDAGDYTATVSSADASAQTDVTVESATTVPSSFTTVVEDGYIELGTGSSAYRINLTECPNGEAPSSDVQCQTATATVDSESGDFTIAPEDLNFDTTVTVGSGIGDVAVQMAAPNGLTGTADWESGETTLNGELNVSAPEFGGDCGASTTISATTGTEGPLSGSEFNVSDGSPAAGTLVDSTYSVPAVSGCPTDYSLLGININTLANSQLGLPSESGNNRLVMDLHMEYAE